MKLRKKCISLFWRFRYFYCFKTTFRKRGFEVITFNADIEQKDADSNETKKSFKTWSIKSSCHDILEYAKKHNIMVLQKVKQPYS